MKDYYREVIKEKFLIRQKNNSRYSLRSYAKDLGINSSTLSQVLRDKRRLPKKYLKGIAKQLKLSEVEEEKFYKSYELNEVFLDQINISSYSEKTQVTEDTSYAIIAEWEYYAVLELLNLAEFDFSINNVATKLEITEERAKQVISDLIENEFLKFEKGIYSKNYGHLSTSEDVKSEALVESHLQTLEMAKEKLKLDVEIRDFSSLVFSIDIDNINNAKKIIREFRMKMLELCKRDKKTDVYQLAIQLFPLSEVSRLKDK